MAAQFCQLWYLSFRTREEQARKRRKPDVESTNVTSQVFGFGRWVCWNNGVKWENTPWGEYWTKLQTEVAGGTTPDVVGMVSMYSQQYIRQGTLLGLKSFIEREPDVKVDDFWPAIMPAYRWKDDTYAFPY